MDLVVFGDDWNAHPSTTQHLIMNMDPSDRIIWVDSLGFRSPRLTITDLKRVMGKIVSIFKSNRKAQSTSDKQVLTDHLAGFIRISPMVLPFHLNPLARRFNTWSLHRSLSAAMKILAVDTPFWLTVTPVAVQYLQAIPYRKIAYLRLDDYGKLPGVDPALIARTEPEMMKHADLIFGTAKNLLPESWPDKSQYLPQGVDTEHFEQASSKPSGKRILGFFGLIAEWLDFELIKKLALETQELGWSLEFIGPVRYRPKELEDVANIHWKDAVPFQDLPGAVKEWTCAWIPFEVSTLTAAVNPLKVREYLAAGLATHCTPLPEVESLSERVDILISQDAREIAEWLESCFATDSVEKRLARRESVRGDSWVHRAKTVRDYFALEVKEG